jgi:hypothetical protein
MNADNGLSKSSLSHLCLSVFICGSIVFSPGCKSATESGHNTALSGVDLIQMTDDMAMKIAGDPDVRREYQLNGPLKIVVEPVQNEMTAEVLPRGAAEEFTTRIRTLLSHHAPEEFTWVLNRETFYRLRGRELDTDLGPSPDAVNPRWALTATFSSITSESKQGRSAYYLCNYQLTDLAHRNLLWTDKYELKKTVMREFLD